MTYYTYNWENVHLQWQKESAFRTPAQGFDTANVAGDTFYAFPLTKWRIGYLMVMRNKQWQHVAGGVDFGTIIEGDYDALEWSLEGDVMDFSLMFPLCTACTNVGAGAPYTHTYINTTARAAEKPSIAVLMNIINDTAAQNLHVLLVGTIVKSYEETGTIGQTIHGRYVFQSAKGIAGAALTTYAAYPQSALNAYHMGDSNNAGTYKKGGTAYEGWFQSYRIFYDDGAFLHKAMGEPYCARVLKGPRIIEVEFDFVPKYKLVTTDVHDLASTTASDVDIEIKVARSATDYIDRTFEKCYQVKTSYDSWLREWHLQGKHKFILKPVAYETGAKLTIAESNAFDATRYA